MTAKRFALILILALLAVPPADGIAAEGIGHAQARTYTTPSMPTIPVTVVVGPKPCGAELLGCSNLADTVYVVKAWPDVIAHEVGHILDYTQLDDAERAAFLEAVGLPGLPWWGESGIASYTVGGGEVFADVYATCATKRFLRARFGYSIGEGLMLGKYVEAGCQAIAAAA